MIAVVVVAVMVMGIVARSIIMPVLICAVMLVGMFSVVVTATPAHVTMSMNIRRDYQVNHPDHQGDG